MKKTWANATIEELTINQTLGGAQVKSEHDGVWMQDADGKWWEATTPITSEGK